MRTLGKVVGSAEDFTLVAPTLVSLGRTHAAAGVTAEHFDLLIECLTGALADAMGPALWTRETKDVWHHVIDSIAAALLRGYPGGDESRRGLSAAPAPIAE